LKINFKLKYLIVLTLLVSFNNFALQSNSSAPEVTAAVVSISFWDLPYLKQAFNDSIPENRKYGLSVDDLVANGADKAMILQLAITGNIR